MRSPRPRSRCCASIPGIEVERVEPEPRIVSLVGAHPRRKTRAGG